MSPRSPFFPVAAAVSRCGRFPLSPACFAPSVWPSAAYRELVSAPRKWTRSSISGSVSPSRCIPPSRYGFGIAPLVVVIDDVPERRHRAVMHVRAGDGDVAQRRGLERADVVRVLRDEESPELGEFRLDRELVNLLFVPRLRRRRAPRARAPGSPPGARRSRCCGTSDPRTAATWRFRRGIRYTAPCR